MDLNIVVHRFMDNVNDRDHPGLVINKIKMAIKLGFQVVALNVVVGPDKLSGKEIQIPEPLSVIFENADKPIVKVDGKRFRVITRLTAIVDDTLQCHKLAQSPVVKKYDILALQPKNEKMFQHVCSTADADIISLNLTSRLPFVLRRQQIGVAVQRGMFFEIAYAPCFRDKIQRQSTFSMALLLTTVCKSKHIILSSGAQKPMELRAPGDVSNLGDLFGMKQNLSKQAVWENCKKAIRHGELRKTAGQAIVSATDASSIPEADAWLMAAFDVPDAEIGGETSQNVTNVADDDTEVIDLTDETPEKVKMSDGDPPPQKRIRLD